MSSTVTNRKENERTKLIQEKCQTLLTQMLRDEDNKYCVDCDAKGPRWASWNLGVFLCIRCAGIHRNLGVHISRVKSVNLDTWTPEQVISLQQMGNSRARAVYEAQLPDNFRRPQIDTALESFIRAKYEHKKYLAREWVPPSPPKVDWAREIDEELEKQKRKKKAAQTGSSLGLSAMSSSASMSADKKLGSSSANAKSVPLPAPLPKPKSTHSGGTSNSPQTQRTQTMFSAVDTVSTTNDLLGLTSPTKPTAVLGQTELLTDLNNDSFSNFLSAAPAVDATKPLAPANNSVNATNTTASLAQEEQDFFKQGSLQTGEKDKSGKLTKDSILALYGNSNSHTTQQPQPQLAFGQPHSMFTGLAPAYMGASAAPQQFMTPPNSVSMYNAPVMAAPAVMSAAAMGLGGTQYAGAQFPMQNSALGGFSQQMPAGIGMNLLGNAGNSMHVLPNQQQPLFGMSMPMMQPQQQQQPPMHFPQSMNGMMGGVGIAGATSSAPAAGNNNLNQQFSNLNIGNVWQ